ncbi:hypothetical protein L2E82_11445 [Cichorium intybus]|uniref:Uncharacterized protein n=1 Tax=Cichorium intybus TaxID=13427 RepID=A0ACB9GEF9_CICIN|nr:hypothetical protein L2E82_11445 [Cichorium intybus]
MDTIKTVIQSCHTDQRSIPYIGKSILSERGLSGLYRGITSNIASSAPIFAIYNFSYESVKGALLPFFAKEHHSCWNAFWGIIRKGGFSSLYNGCGAVLCRNVPHSIIKFYTYESLKSMQANAHPTTISMLLCGGLAGSTVVLFTTPFDVIHGCVNRYHGVIDTLKDISQHEDMKGLYRGLTPRLAIQRDDINFWI